jgi:Acetylornithine deacetylase/Succinyl-diaminopimelate desuccinylase and related deacylases
VVSGVQGISWQRITLDEEANHAGTAPMAFRHDAGYEAAATIAFLREQITAAAPGTTLATVGSLRVEPDVINVVPQRAIFTVDLRDPDEGRLHAAEAALAEFLTDLVAREGLKVTQERLVRFEPVRFHKGLRARIQRAAEAAEEAPFTLTSGAGHDAQMLARVAPAAMIFVPSVRGISHNPAEHTSEADLALGAEVLLRVVEDCLAVPLGVQP